MLHTCNPSSGQRQVNTANSEASLVYIEIQAGQRGIILEVLVEANSNLWCSICTADERHPRLCRLNRRQVVRNLLTRSPDSINMCMLVFLLTTALGPPRTGVSGSRRQLWGGSRASGTGAAGFLSINHNGKNERAWSSASEKLPWPPGEPSSTDRAQLPSSVSSLPADDGLLTELQQFPG